MTDSAPGASNDTNSIPQPDGYALWLVLRRGPRRHYPGAAHPAPAVAEASEAAAVAELDQAVAEITQRGVTVRGFYDVSGLKADADLMVWLWGTDPQALQAAARVLRRTSLFERLLPTWNALGVHRAAEFNKAHIPGFLRGEHARQWLTVYPFNRSYDWYILPDDERRKMLADHGRRGSAFKGVVANTVAGFALGDYEWILPMEADDLLELVDMMHDLRKTEARLHVREETPFFTGRLIQTREIPEVVR